jgi:hypothetical protein
MAWAQFLARLSHPGASRSWRPGFCCRSKWCAPRRSWHAPRELAASLLHGEIRIRNGQLAIVRRDLQVALASADDLAGRERGEDAEARLNAPIAVAVRMSHFEP